MNWYRYGDFHYLNLENKLLFTVSRTKDKKGWYWFVNDLIDNKGFASTDKFPHLFMAKKEVEDYIQIISDKVTTKMIYDLFGI